MRLFTTLGLGQVAGRGSVALATLLLVRVLDESEYGSLAFALALVAIFVTVADAGFGRLLVRDVAREGADPSALVVRLLTVRLIGVAAVGGLAVVAFTLGLGGFDTEVCAVLVAYLVAEAIAFGFENAAVGAEKPWRFVRAQTLGGLSLLAGAAFLLARGRASLLDALLVFLAGSGIKVLGHLHAWYSQPRGVTGDRRSARDLLRDALPFLLLTLLATVYYRVGVIALHELRGPSETASLGVAMRVVDVVAIVGGLLFASSSPALSRAHRERPESVWDVWRGAVMKACLFSFPTAGVLAAFAPSLCGLLFGAEYAESAGADLRWLAPGLALIVPQAVSASVVFMSDRRTGVLLLTLVNVAFCVALTVLLSSAFGSNGAAAALSAAEVLSFASFALLISHGYRDRGVGAPGRRRAIP